MGSSRERGQGTGTGMAKQAQNLDATAKTVQDLVWDGENAFVFTLDTSELGYFLSKTTYFKLNPASSIDKAHVLLGPMFPAVPHALKWFGPTYNKRT